MSNSGAIDGPRARHRLLSFDRTIWALRFTLQLLHGVVTSIFHKIAPLFQQVAAPVGGLGLVLNSVSQRHLADLARKIRVLGRPIAKLRPKAVRGDRQVHPLEQFKHRHAAKRLVNAAPGKDEVRAGGQDLSLEGRRRSRGS